jgi:parallel beta-helix repeat protein
MGGGGIKVSHCSPTIRNCYFSGNIAYNQGGAIYISTNSDPFIEDCIFEDSGAGYEGGAIYMVAIAPTIRRCDFVRNEGRRGGAIYIGEAAPHILDCTFAGNHTFGAGGTLFFNIDPPEGQAVIESCLFHENTGLYGGTGIVCTEGAKPLLSNLTIVGNYGSTMNGAGISSFVQANPVIENCIVANNDGPGIYVGGTADVTINCSNVVGNTEGDYYGNILNQTGLNGNISEAPLFCDYDNWVLTLAEQSPCLPENNDCGVLMGALGMDCTLTDVSEVPGYGVQLLPCFPNPFNPHTTISLHVEDPAMVRITIHDVTGRQIRILHEGWHEAGHRDLTWNGLDEAGKDAPSGIYFVVLDGPAGRSSQKITLLR